MNEQPAVALGSPDSLKVGCRLKQAAVTLLLRLAANSESGVTTLRQQLYCFVRGDSNNPACMTT